MSTYRILGIVAVLVIVVAAVVFFLAQETFENTLEGEAIAAEFSAGDLEGMVEAAEAGVERYPNDPASHTALAFAYAHTGSALFAEDVFGPEAVAAAEAALALDPTFVDGYRALGYAYETMQQFDDAFNAYDTGLSLAPNDAMLLAQKAHAFDRSGEPDEALILLEQAITADPTLAQPRLNYAQLILNYSDDPDAVNRAISLAEDVAETSTETLTRSQAHTLLGTIALTAEEYEQAEQHFTDAISEDPSNVVAGMGVGWSRFFRIDEYDDGSDGLVAEINLLFEIISEALRSNPHHTSAWYLAALLNEMTEDVDEARALVVHARDVALPLDTTLSANQKKSFELRLSEELERLTQ